MARDTQKKRAELRDKLIDIAESEIRESGVHALRARALAQQAGCAVGAIYNVFEDLNGPIRAVNGRTFVRLGALVSERVASSNGPPVDRLVIMGHSYLAFASDNPNLWRALFDVEMTADSGVPDWYLQELGMLFQIIAQPLAELHPDAGPSEIDLMTRTLFSSVHGIVLLGLERRISAVPVAQIERMISELLTRYTTARNTH